MPHSLPLSNLNNLGRSSNFLLRPAIKFSVLPNMLTIIKNNNKTLLSVNNKKEKDTKNGLSTSTEVSKQEIYKLQVSI